MSSHCPACEADPTRDCCAPTFPWVRAGLTGGLAVFGGMILAPNMMPGWDAMLDDDPMYKLFVGGGSVLTGAFLLGNTLRGYQADLDMAEHLATMDEAPSYEGAHFTPAFHGPEKTVGDTLVGAGALGLGVLGGIAGHFTGRALGLKSTFIPVFVGGLLPIIAFAPTKDATA